MKRIYGGSVFYSMIVGDDFLVAAIVVTVLTGVGIYLLVTGIQRSREAKRRAQLRADIADQTGWKS